MIGLRLDLEREEDDKLLQKWIKEIKEVTDPKNVEEQLKKSFEAIPPETSRSLQTCMHDLHAAAVEYGRLQEAYKNKSDDATRNQVTASFQELSNCAKAYYKVDQEIRKILGGKGLFDVDTNNPNL